MQKTVTTDFSDIVHEFDALGYDISFKDYMDSYGPGHTAVAINRKTKKRRTMTDRYEARNCNAIAAKLLTKLRREQCGHECHYHETYSFVPESGCPVHD